MVWVGILVGPTLKVNLVLSIDEKQSVSLAREAQTLGNHAAYVLKVSAQRQSARPRRAGETAIYKQILVILH